MCFVRSSNPPLTGHTKNVRVRRGTKAGRRLIRHIHTVSVDRSRYVKHQKSSVNMGNLVCIPCNAPNTHISTISGPDEPIEIVPIPPVDDQFSKQRRIQVKVSLKRNANIKQLSGVNKYNLVHIPTTNKHVHITDKSISLHLINARSVAGKAISIC